VSDLLPQERLHLCRAELLVNQSLQKAQAQAVKRDGEKVRALRLVHGLTHEQLAARFGVSVAVIKEILRGAK
jgi:DNA-binding transcriptional regulator YiaG